MIKQTFFLISQALKKRTSENARLKEVSLKFIGKESNSSAFQEQEEKVGKEIYVGNIPSETTIDEMKEYFMQYGTVKNVFILNKHLTSQNGLVLFSEESMAQAALDGGPHYIDGRGIICNKAKGRRNHRAGADKENSSFKMKSPSSSKAKRNSPY